MVKMENPTVKELVKRFEAWERSREEKTAIKAGLSRPMSGSSDDLPVVTPRGQVRKLRDQLEAKTRMHEASTLIPAKKTSNLRRVATSYYQPVTNAADDDIVSKTPTRTKSDDVANEGETQEPYVHVDAYWDEATKAYWYPADDRWLVYDELAQEFIEPTDAADKINLPPQVAANMNSRSISPVSSSPSPLSGSLSHRPMSPFQGLGTTRTVRTSPFTDRPGSFPSLPKSLSKGSPSTPTTHQVHVPPKPIHPGTRQVESEEDSREGILLNTMRDEQVATGQEKISMASISLFNTSLSDTSIKVDIPLSIIRKFHLGVQLYALVKNNGGMLKPIILHLAVDRGKVYIVRQGRSRFLTVGHFSSCDYSPSCVDFMAKNGKKTDTTSKDMKDTIHGLRQQPLVVLWTSVHFSNRHKDKNSLSTKENKSHLRGMAFVFDNRVLRGEFLKVLRAMVYKWLTPHGIPFEFKEKDDPISDCLTDPEQPETNVLTERMEGLSQASGQPGRPPMYHHEEDGSGRAY